MKTPADNVAEAFAEVAARHPVDSLLDEIIALSEQTMLAYHKALDAGNIELAAGLRAVGREIARLLAVQARGAAQETVPRCARCGEGMAIEFAVDGVCEDCADDTRRDDLESQLDDLLAETP